MKKKNLFLYFLCCSLVYAEKKKEVTITDAFTAAYGNKKMQSAREAAKASHEKIVQARSGFLPQISLNAQHSRNKEVKTNDGSTSLQNGFGDSYSKQGGASLTQNIFNSGATFAEIRGAKAQINSAWAELEKTEQENFLKVAQVYLEIIAAQKNVEITKGNIKFLKKQYESALEKHKVGEETITNVSASEAELYNGEAEYESALANLKSLKEQYEQMTQSSAPNSFISPNASDGIKICSEVSGDDQNDHHYAVRLAKAKIDSVEAGADTTISKHLPKIDFSADVNRVENKTKNSTISPPGRQYSTNFQFSTKFSMPLYDGGQIRAKHREDLRNLTAAKISYQNTKDEVKTSITNAVIKFKSLEKTYKANEKVVKASKKSVDSLTEEHKAGSKTLLDVLQQQQKYFQAQKKFVDTEQQYLKSCYELASAKGELNARRLGLKVDYDEVDKDYKVTRRRF